MDSIINFIINCILSIMDLYLINFYVLNYNYRTDENKKYIELNLYNFICFIIILFSCILPSNYVITILLTIIVLFLQLKYSSLSLYLNIKLMIKFIILKISIHFICHFIFT